jgi:Nif-specific regulatory protein
LLESELFGYVRGAFTGATETRAGFFQTAEGGTLFLDEISETSASMQVKLLRVLQDKEVCMVGDTRVRKVDVRVIAATNKDLLTLVQKNVFREDLFFRLNVITITIPPLRERGDDVLRLANYFASKYSREFSRPVPRFTEAALRIMSGYYWPGNVRELENCIERTATMTKGEVIETLSFPCSHDRCLTRTLHEPDHVETQVVPLKAVGRLVPPQSADSPNPDGIDLETALMCDQAPGTERDRLIWAMEQCGWVQAKAARLLNITPRQIGYALQKHNIEVRKF